MKQKINKKMTFAEVMQKHPEAAETLMEAGMHCCGCPMAMDETIEQGSLAHGLDADKIIEKINKKSKNKK